MRFTVFQAASISPARLLLGRVAAAKRAVQAEKDRYPALFRAREVRDHRKPPGRIAPTQIDFRRPTS